jgi:hypothetical protein
MKKFDRSASAAAFLTAALGVLVLAAAGRAQAQPIMFCEVRLRVELTPDVPDPRDAGFLSSLLNNHPEYRLTLRRQDSADGDVLALDLTGPGPLAYCREVIESIRRDARVVSVAAGSESPP